MLEKVKASVAFYAFLKIIFSCTQSVTTRRHMTARERIVSIFDREIRLLAAGKKYKNRIAENELEQIKKVFSRAIDTEQEKLSSDDIYRMIRLNS